MLVENTITEIGRPFIALNTTRGSREANLDRTPAVHLSWASPQPPKSGKELILITRKCCNQGFQRYVLSQRLNVGLLTRVWPSSFDGFRTPLLLEIPESYLLSSYWVWCRERYPLTSQLIEENKIPEFGQ